MDNSELHQKIAIFGSAFNPPTLGHLSVVERLRHFEKVLLVPSFSHAWGKKTTDFEKRCDWVSAFINDSSCTNLELCVEEKRISQGQSVTTWALLNHLQGQCYDAELTFVIGPDNFRNFGKFFRSEDILNQWNVLSCPEIVPIRSTQIRERLSKGEDISTLTTPRLALKITGIDFE